MIKKVITFAMLSVVTISFSQEKGTSIYSFFGIGESDISKNVGQLSMGGVGVSYADNYRLNISNPASLASLQFVTYGLGGANKNRFLKDKNTNQFNSSFSLSHLTLGVPLGERGGVSFGVMPHSKVGYYLKKTEYGKNKNISEITVFEGKGGVNKLFLGIGYRIFKSTSIGVQVDYLFGNTTKTVTNQKAKTSLASIYKYASSVKGVLVNLGIQNKLKINKKLHLHTGATLQLKNKIKDKEHQHFYSLSSSIPGDTILNQTKNIERKIPARVNVGIGVGEDFKWFAGVDYTFRDKYDFTVAANSQNLNAKYGKYSKLQVGGFYTPKFNSVINYWQRVTYRAGVFYENTGLSLKPKSSKSSNYQWVNNFGMTFGIELPTGNGLSNVNLGVELGRKGTTVNSLVEENYFNFRVGLSLNDRWFIKRKIF